MSKGNRFARFLYLPAVCLCGYTGSLILSAAGPARQEPSELRRKTASVYTAQLHVRERGNNNHGTEVARYLAYTGLPEGHPWCAAFVCWVYGQAGIQNPRTAWSPSLFPASKIIWQQGRHNTLQPRQADVFGIWFADKGRIAHAGFVDRWEDKWVVTVEGNTNEAGSREGDGVYRKRRPVKSIYRVARYISH